MFSSFHHIIAHFALVFVYLDFILILQIFKTFFLFNYKLNKYFKSLHCLPVFKCYGSGRISLAFLFCCINAFPVRVGLHDF